MTAARRPKLFELTPDQLKPLESRFTPQWSETCKDLARSCYITLLCRTLPASFIPEELAVELVLGIAKDIGGTQPYIPTGFNKAKGESVERAMRLLAQGHGYKSVADQCGITVSHVRRMEREARNLRRACA